MIDKAGIGNLLYRSDVRIGIEKTLVGPGTDVCPRSVEMMTMNIQTLLMSADVEDGVGGGAAPDV